MALSCDSPPRPTGNVGPGALDLVRLVKEDHRAASSSPLTVRIPIRNGCPLLAEGWEPSLRREHGERFVVSTGPKAGLSLPFLPRSSGSVNISLQLKHIAGFNEDGRPVRFQILFNGSAAGEVLLYPDRWTENTLVLNADQFHGGANELAVFPGKGEPVAASEVRYALSEISVALPGLAAAVQVGRLQKQVLLSGGPMTVDLPFPLPNGAELYASPLPIADVVPAAGAPVRYLLEVVSQDNRHSTDQTVGLVWTLMPGGKLEKETRESGSQSSGSKHFLRLDEFAGRRVRITLRAESGDESGSDSEASAWGPVILTWPDGSAPAPRDLNVIVILADTLRADRIGAYGEARPLTPALDSLCRRAAVFEDALAQAPNTVPSVSSLITGKYYQWIDPWVQKQTLPPEPVMAEWMAASGRRTVALVSNPLLLPETGYARGFDEYDQSLAWQGAEMVNEAFFGRLPLLQRTSFFAYLHYMDIHDPYGGGDAFMPPEFTTGRLADTPVTGEIKPVIDEIIRHGETSLGPEDCRMLNALYEQGIQWFDFHLGRLLAVLRGRGLLERTVVVVIADHGEELFDRGLIGHGHSLYAELLHVPLIVLLPESLGVPQPARIESPVELLDLGPTLAGLLDSAVPHGHQGRDLTPLLRITGEGERSATPEKDGYRFFETRRRYWVRPPFNGYLAGISDGEWKLIRNRRTGTEQLYNLRLDPGETGDLAAGHDRETDRLRHRLREWLMEMTVSRDEPEDDVTAGESARAKREMEALRALGYVQE